MEIKPNYPPILQNIEDIHALVPDAITYVVSTSGCKDPEYLPLIMTISMADGTILPSFFTWIEGSRTLLITPSNDKAGIYQLRFTCHDSINDALTTDFKVTIKSNLPPSVNNIPETRFETVATLFFSFALPTDAFVDPEGIPFSLGELVRFWLFVDWFQPFVWPADRRQQKRFSAAPLLWPDRQTFFESQKNGSTETHRWEG